MTELKMSYNITFGNRIIPFRHTKPNEYHVFSQQKKEKSVDVTSKRELFDNLNRLNKFSRFSKNWNGYNADPISSRVIRNAKEVLYLLQFQPEVFPTAANTIQFEYDGPYDSYLEFQVGDNQVFNLFYVDNKGNKKHINDVSVCELNNRIEDFYECRL